MYLLQRYRYINVWLLKKKKEEEEEAVPTATMAVGPKRELKKSDQAVQEEARQRKRLELKKK